MKFQMYVDVVVRDRNGKVIQRIRKRKCSSYVIALIDHLNSFMGAANNTIKDTGGTNRSYEPATYAANISMNVAGGATVTTFGIRAGTGTTAVTISDYAVETPIAEGTGAGQLSHGATSVGAPSTVGSSRQFTIARTFTNNSGASITVNEVGLYSRYSTVYYFMLERSLLTFSIANGASATVTYTIKVTV